MYSVHILLFLCCLFCLNFTNGLFIQDYAIHESMSEPELAVVFNSQSSKNVPEYQIIYLPVIQLQEASGTNEQETEVNYGFSAFDTYIDLNLKPNKNLLAPNFKSYFWSNNNYPSISEYSNRNCHYLHKNQSVVAAFAICEPEAIQGLIFLQNSTLEVHPVPKRLHTMLKRNKIDDDLKIPHIVRRASLNPEIYHNDALPLSANRFEANQFQKERSSHRPASGILTAEVALFFDEAGYNIFAPYLDYDDKKLHDMLLAYVNGVQALYHHPTIGTSLELSLVRMDIMKKQPAKMRHYDGERSKLLDSFCAYQRSLNPKDDDNPDHWDMALYVSGLDFFAYENGRKNGATMGLATVGGVCLEKYNCIIAELGTTNVYGKPYPSAGFTSVYILAHEIGHNLGMHHDSSGNSCPKEGYIMSPSRGTNGETQWSTCSAQIMSKLGWADCLKDFPQRSDKKLDHTKYLDSPGQVYTAKRQCEILLRDKAAVVVPSQKMNTICQNLQCKTPHRSGFYFAGPALDGTPCGKKQYCYGGECVSKKPPNPVKIVPGGWSQWRTSGCSSGCIENSLGHETKQRFCNNPTPVNTDQGCDGPSYSVGLCSDHKLCRSNRTSAEAYASKRCKDFSKLLPELDSEGLGLQAPHEEERLWMGCAIFCKRSDSSSFFTPRVELNDLGISPYFPDGTWCHENAGVNYYCLQHHCLPENFEFGKNFDKLLGPGEEIPQNAFPSGDFSDDVKNYFSLGSDLKPLQHVLQTDDFKHLEKEEWDVKDYVDLPPGVRTQAVETDEDIFEEYFLEK